jgi:predicted small secreted protein
MLRVPVSLLLVLITVTACSNTIPVAVIGQDGKIFTGSNTYSLSEGSFSVTNGKITCAGSYNPLVQSSTISMPVTCDDGRKGIVRSIRDTSSSGSGTFVLNDGYRGDFIFGPAAASFSQK